MKEASYTQTINDLSKITGYKRYLMLRGNGYITLYSEINLKGNSTIIRSVSKCYDLLKWKSLKFHLEVIAIVYGAPNFKVPLFSIANPNEYLLLDSVFINQTTSKNMVNQNLN